MDRRNFLRRAAIVAAGAIAADQLDLLERLTHRKNWPGASFGPRFLTSRKVPPGTVIGVDPDFITVMWSQGVEDDVTDMLRRQRRATDTRKRGLLRLS